MKIILFLILFLPAWLHAETIELGVEGMVCGSCANKIEKAFGKYPGVQKTEVSLEKKLVTVSTKEKKTLTDNDLKKTITDMGYKVTAIARKP